LAEPLVSIAGHMSAAFRTLAPHASPMAPRKAQQRDIVSVLGACASGRAVFAFSKDAAAIIAVLIADAPDAAAVMTGGSGGVRGRLAVATPLELGLARLLVDEGAKAAGWHADAAELPAAIGQDTAGWHGVAIALEEARGKGGAPVLWGLMRRGDAATAGDRSATGSDVRRRLGQAEAALTHSMPVGRRPFGALRELGEGDVIELGAMDSLALFGRSNGQTVYTSVPAFRNGRLIARVTSLVEQPESKFDHD
jgi:hypothetical protein